MYSTCYNVNYFVSQPVGLDFTSGSGFCQWSGFCEWVWIASGFEYENPMGQTPCCIMWSTHNHGIKYVSRDVSSVSNSFTLFTFTWNIARGVMWRMGIVLGPESELLISRTSLWLTRISLQFAWGYDQAIRCTCV